jgi:hypothetical protein
VTAYLDGTAGVGGDADGDTLSAIENLTGSGFADTLYGDGGNNVINGGDGNDTIIGGAGADTISGGAGSDTASYAGSSAISLDLTGTTGTGSAGDASGDTLTGIESVIGSAFGDLFQLSLTPGWNVNGGSGGYDVVALANDSGTVTAGMLQGVLGNIDEIDFTGTGVDGSLTIGSSFIQSVVGGGTGSQLTIKLDVSDSLTIESGSFYEKSGTNYTFYSDSSLQTEVARLSVSG